MTKAQREAAAAAAAAGIPGTTNTPAADSAPDAEQASSTDGTDAALDADTALDTDDDLDTDDEDDAPTLESRTAEAKELMKRFGLKKVAIDSKLSIHFDASHIEQLEALGEESLTFIER